MKSNIYRKHILIRILGYFFTWLFIVVAAELFRGWLHSTEYPFVTQLFLKSDEGEPLDTPFWEIFFSVFGLIYAIVIGLFIVEAHRRARDLAIAVQNELSAIGDIIDFLRYIENGSKKVLRERATRVIKVIEALETYTTKEVIEDLDPTSQTDSSTHSVWGWISSALRSLVSPSPDNKVAVINRRREEVSAIIDAVKSLLPHHAFPGSSEKPAAGESAVVDNDDKYALEAIINKIGAMTTFRAQKTEVAQRGFPPAFYVLMVFMSLVIIVGIGLLDVHSTELHILLMFFTSSATSFLFLLVVDLDNPLTGYWNIKDELDGDVFAIQHRLKSAIERLEAAV